MDKAMSVEPKPGPNAELARKQGWTHQLQYEAYNGENEDTGKSIYVPCFVRFTSKEAAERGADEARQDPLNRNVEVAALNILEQHNG